MTKNIIIIFLLVFVIFYAGQIAVYRSLEKLKSREIKQQGMEALDVSIMLGAKPSDKYIPGLGIARIATSEPCRIEITYKGQTVSEPIEKQDSVDLEKGVHAHIGRQKIYVTVKGQGIDKRFELERTPAK